MKRNRLIAYIIMLSLIVTLVGIQPKEAQAATNTAMLGGQQTKGCLKIIIANGNIDVYRFDGYTFVRQYYTAADAVLDVNGMLYALGTYFNGAKQMPISSLVANERTVVTTWLNSRFELKQTVTLPSSTAQYIELEWSVKNIGNEPLTNMHFLRGEDTYLAGGDNGAGYWDAATNSIGVSKVVNGVTQRLYMQGITIPNSYISANYYTVMQDVGNGGVLSKEINPFESTDNGYALEWKNDVLNPSDTWTIRANECFVSSAVIASGSAAVTSVSGGAITVGYTVNNSSSVPQPVTYSVEGPQGWTITPDILSDVIAPRSQGEVHVTVLPSPDAVGGTYNIILNVATNDSTSQSISTITIAEPLAAPTVTVDDINNVLIGINDTMEYSTDEETSWNAYSSSNPPVFEGNRTIYVRVKATAVSPASDSTRVSFTQALAPVLSVDDENNCIVGMTDSMEYSIDGGIHWSSYNSGNPPVFQGQMTVQVRVKATVDNDASEAAILRFHPNTIADDVNNVLDNVDSSMEYSTDGGVLWTSYDPANAPTFAGGITVLVRKKAGDSVRFDFAEKTIVGSSLSVVSGTAITVSGSAVTVVSGSVITADGSPVTVVSGSAISGSAIVVDLTNHDMSATDDTFEYSEDNGGSWQDCAIASVIKVTENATILVRKKAGSIRTVTFTDNPAVPPSPSVTVDDRNNTVLGADNTMEYTTDGGGTWTTYDGDNPPAFRGTITVGVRKKAGEIVVINDTSRTITGNDINVVPGIAASVTGSSVTVVADFTNNKLIGVYEAMEYSTDNGSTWISITSSTLDFADNAVVLLRKKAGNITTLQFTSNPPAAPSVRIDDTNHTILGADASMEYSTDGGATWKDYLVVNSPIFTGTVDVLIRVKASGINPAGEITTLHFISNSGSTSNIGASESDKKAKRQVEVTLDSNPAALVDITRSEENNKAVDSVTVDRKIIDETLKNKKNPADKLIIYVKDELDNPAEEVHFNIKADALKKIAESGLDVVLKSDDVTITLTKDRLQKLVDQENDLYFRLIPLKTSKDLKRAKIDTLSSELVKKYATYRNISIIGTPMKIDTNYQNQKTDVVFSAKSLNLPEDPALLKNIGNNFAVYVVHSDGDIELLPGTLVYGEDGVIDGVKITIDKFSTFTFIRTTNTAPTISNLKIKVVDKIDNNSGKILKISYTYEDADQDKEGNTKFQWYRADNKEGINKIKISSANKSSYTLTEEDEGQFLLCEVIPKAKTGVRTGTSACHYEQIMNSNDTDTEHVTDKNLKEQETQDQQVTDKKPTTKADTEANKSIVKDPSSKTDSSTSSKTNSKHKVIVKLGLVGSKTYAEELSDIFTIKYHASNVKVTQEGRYYRVSAEFTTITEAEKACKELKNKSYIMNYYIGA